jgi:hypothetical protein
VPPGHMVIARADQSVELEPFPAAQRIAAE